MAENTAEPITPRQQRAVRALMENRTNGEAAKAAGIGERTLYRWLSEPLFRQALQDAENQAADMTARRLATGTRLALDVLVTILESEAAGDTLRLQAAKAWLENYHRARDDGDLDRRITALEASAAVNSWSN